jgi:hypothetical protein
VTLAVWRVAQFRRHIELGKVRDKLTFFALRDVE